LPSTSRDDAACVLNFAYLVLEMTVQELMFGVLVWQVDDLLEIQNINAVCLPENYRLNVGVAFSYSCRGL
jgi:hypothetical protein